MKKKTKKKNKKKKKKPKKKNPFIEKFFNYNLKKNLFHLLT